MTKLRFDPFDYVLAQVTINLRSTKASKFRGYTFAMDIDGSTTIKQVRDEVEKVHKRSAAIRKRRIIGIEIHL